MRLGKMYSMVVGMMNAPGVVVVETETVSRCSVEMTS